MKLKIHDYLTSSNPLVNYMNVMNCKTLSDEDKAWMSDAVWIESKDRALLLEEHRYAPPKEYVLSDNSEAGPTYSPAHYRGDSYD